MDPERRTPVLMKRFYTAIVRRRRLVLAVFALAAVLSVFAVRQVKVDYDINDYLPPESPSTTAIEVMNGAFTGGIPNMRVMVRDVTVPQALEYKEKLAAIDGVSSVAWLDDSLDVTVPLQMQDTATVESYYKDGCALFTVTVEDEKRLEAVAAVRDLIGEGNALEGAAVSTAVATNSTVTEVAKIAAIAVVYVLFILILTTDSWAEPLLVLTGLGAAILLNNGTNLIFGTISFVTNAAGSILQLAVSLDYSVFLIHRFAECRAENPDASPEECMVDALCRSTGSILSSGLTTVIGFLALVLMQFQIGPDLGLALAKGVVLSLVTVFTFMPALTLAAYQWMDKTHHRPLLPSFDKFGRFVARIMLPMALVLVILMVPSYLASNSNQYYYGAAHMFGENTRLGADTAAIEETFGRSDTYVVLVPEGDTATQQKLSDALHAIPEVTGILSYVDNAGASIPPEFVPGDTLGLLVSGGYTRLVLTVDADTEGDGAFALVERVRATVQQYYPDNYYLAGQGVSTYDLMDTITADMVKVNLLAIGAVFLILLLMKRQLLLPVILVLSIETAIWINLAIPYFRGQYVFYIAYLIISSVQLGATVANVGSKKQLSYILLPGADSDVTVTADVTDFAMDAVSLNGVRLNLNLDLGDMDLTGMLEQLQSGSVQLDDGANALADGIAQVQAGIDTLNGNSGTLTGGSARVRAALTQMQTALNGISASTDELNTLLDASTQIRDGIARLDEGAAQLEQQVSFEAYKAILKENGLDLDVVKEGNAKAIQQLQGMVWMMPQLKDVILLLQGSTANIDAMQTYLDTVNGGIAQLHEGSSTLNGSYGEFDAGVRQLAGVLTGMLGNLSVLTDGVNQLAAQYVQLDDGLNAYTDGVAQLKAGVAQLAEGAAQLTGGTGELRSSVSGIDMGAQLDGLLNSLSGGGEVQSFTSAENTEVGAVQFALQTTAITAPAPAAQPESAAVTLTFWQKLLKLFGLYKG